MTAIPATRAVTHLTPSTTGPVRVHTRTSDERGFSVNGSLIETADGVVAVDTMFTVGDARALRQLLDATGKPLVAVLLTHAHPDHTNGTGTLVAGLATDVPIYALAGVAQVMHAIDAEKRAFWTPVMGDDYPAVTAFPTHLLRDGETFAAGGLTFRAHDFGPGEGADMGLFTIEAGAPEMAFAGDIAYHQVHPWLVEGRSGQWLRQLERAATLLAERHTLFFGHGAPGTVATLHEQIRYIDAYRAAVREIGGAALVLDDAAKATLTARMEQVWPGAALTALIAMSADAVAQELAAASDAPPVSH